MKRKKTRKIKVCVETGYAGCNHEDEFEVEDDVTENEIDEIAWELACNYITVNWWESKEV